MKVGYFTLGTIGWIVFIVLAACCNPASDDGEYARPKDTGAARPFSVALIEQGRSEYANYCIGCHGEQGDGNGESAKFFSPKPRNFVQAEFKFSSTRSGQLPTDDDLRRTIKDGLKGSAMPPFDRLPDRTIDALIAYVKTFSPRWSESDPAKQIPFVEDPYLGEEDLTAAIARGEQLYHGYATCWSCHPAYTEPARINEFRAAFGGVPYESFRDHLHESVGKENTQGDVIFPPDFNRDYVRAGMSVRDLYRSIAAGITGTAMPTWVDSMELGGANEGDPPRAQPEDLWAIAYYVRNLIAQRPIRLDESELVLRNHKREIYLHGEPPKKAAPEPTSQPSDDQPADFGF